MASAMAVTLVAGACTYDNAFMFGAGDDAGSATSTPPTCSNGALDPGESDVDCGGGGCAPCAVGRHCARPEHCVSKSCAGDDPSGAICQPPSFTDGVQNGTETGVDCGGSTDAPKCPMGQPCRVGGDCVDGVCDALRCSSPGATDGVKNGDETDVDCGGPAAPACANGKACALARDCVSGACSAEYGVCAPASATDGVKNDGETDVDCGGPGAGVPRCRDGLQCAAASDCASLVCTGGRCQPPTGDDGVKNGDETDRDCGGASTGAPRCQPGQACVSNADCTMGCSYEHVCLTNRSCTRHFGGDTCGKDETPAQGKGPLHESCCAQGAAFPAGGQTVLLDQYLYTAGRMRAMIEALDGRIKTWVSANRPAWFEPAWLDSLPDDKFSAEQSVGPYGVATRAGCGFGDSGGTSARTYDTDSDILNGAGVADRAVEVPRSLLDEKPLNCVDSFVAAAACAYDGRQLPTVAVLEAAIAGPDGRRNPWGNAPAMWDGSSTYPPEGTAAGLTQGFYSSFQNAGVKGTFVYRWPLAAALENSRGIPAPGRMYNSRGAWGHYDLYGPYLHWVGADSFLYTYSWEVHGRTTTAANYTHLGAYHAIGFRCMQIVP